MLQKENKKNKKGFLSISFSTPARPACAKEVLLLPSFRGHAQRFPDLLILQPAAGISTPKHKPEPE